MTMLAAVIYFVLGAGMILSLWGIMRGPNLADRAVSFDVFVAAGMMWLLLYAIDSGIKELMDILLVTAFMSFLGTTALAYLIEKRGRDL